jgi:aryl-alcohol dehydrogenase-like predicted oxidoreductase
MKMRVLGRTGIEETLSALTDLVRAGKVRGIGCSSMPASAIIGPRTMAQLDDLVAGADTVLDDDVLDRIDKIVPPGTDLGALDVAHVPPAVANPTLRRRPSGARAAA